MVQMGMKQLIFHFLPRKLKKCGQLWKKNYYLCPDRYTFTAKLNKSTGKRVDLLDKIAAKY